jgi:predicted ATPase/DNA-binding SARP family transcriptional activator
VTTLSLTLFGSPQVDLGGSPRAFRLRKELALLVYLAVEQQRPQSRETLVGLFWPELPEAAARNNLRVALANLRRLLDDAEGHFIYADRQHVQFRATSRHQLDVARFRAAVKAVAAHGHGAVEGCESCLALLAEAADRYRGDFLAGFSLPDGGAFEAWASLQREQLHRQALDALETLARAHELKGDHGAQVTLGRRQLALEPWREQAHAAVMRGLWVSGQRAAALEQYELCRRTLEAELGLTPSPELDALAAAIRAGPFAAPRPANGSIAPAGAGPQPAPNEAAPPHNLPAALTALIGREQELSRLETLLARPGCRLLTLVGPGGTGKTTLALELARRRLAAYRNGVFFVELAPLQRPEDVAAAILDTVGGKLRGGQTPETTLATWLRGRQLLLVLDNCEHLLAAAPLMGRLLAAAPGLTILATSREALGLYGEQRFPVPPLALPPAVTPAGASNAVIGDYAAVTLFVQRLQAVRPEFTLTGESAPVIAAICARLDGLPLALELAAARGQRLAPQRILDQLRPDVAGLHLLSGGGRGRTPRQQTMHATIAWSYELLSPVEQAAFRRLAVFVGGWTEAAAAALGVRAEQLHALIDKSLVALSESADGGEPRHAMLETIREYALEQLLACGEEPAARSAHARYFLALAEAAEPQLVGADEWRWMRLLTDEEHNLRAALRWSIERGESSMGLRLGAALVPYWDPRGLYTEGFNWLRELLTLDQPDDAGAPYLRARARALHGAGLYAFWKGDLEPAMALATEGLALSRACGDEPSTARALMTLGNVLGIGLGLPRVAVARYEEALALQLALNNPHGVGVTYYNLGIVTMIDGDYERAEGCFNWAITIFTELRSDSWLRHIMPHHAATLLLRGDRLRAAQILVPALIWDTAADELTLLALTQALLVAALLAALSRSASVAARLVGVVDAITEEAGVDVGKRGDCRLLHTRAAALALTLLGGQAFAALRAAGRELTIDQARQLARSVVEELR